MMIEQEKNGDEKGMVEPMDLLKELNEMQKEAVLATEGPVLIMAGAGSGKTKCLTHRIAYLIKEKKVSPYDILAITFTNKAAGEMKERMAKLLNRGSSANIMPWMGTFHSVCVKILRRETHLLGYDSNFTIYDSDDSLTMVKEVMKKEGIDTKQFAPQSVRFFIGGAKNEMMRAADYERYANGYFQEIVAKVFKIYELELKKNQAMDFDDLIMNTVEVLDQFEEVLEKYQNIFRYILIDEYQDTNEAQYKLTKLLAAKNKNICAVGDDYQAIYGWRGANFKNLLNFEKDYPEARVFKLEQNYRSTKNIIEAAQKVIEKNRLRTDKVLWTENVEGAPITIYQGRTADDESEFIIREILGLQRSGLSLGDFVILYRTNAQSRGLEETLMRFGTPYRIVGALKFYDRKEIKDILAYLRILVNPADEVSLKRVINVPARGIGPKTVEQVLAKGYHLSDDLEGCPNKVKKFFEMMRKIRDEDINLTADKLMRKILEVSGYKAFILDGTPEGEARWENLEELMNVASLADSLEEFLEKTALISDVDNYEEGNEAITLMTVHCAKGLEFPVVFISGMEEGIFPHSRALMDSGELEEERRLCYVAITRAKERLYITHVLMRIVYGGIQSNSPSRFISDIPEYMVERLDY